MPDIQPFIPLNQTKITVCYWNVSFIPCYPKNKWRVEGLDGLSCPVMDYNHVTIRMIQQTWFTSTGLKWPVWDHAYAVLMCGISCVRLSRHWSCRWNRYCLCGALCYIIVLHREEIEDRWSMSTWVSKPSFQLNNIISPRTIFFQWDCQKCITWLPPLRA